MIKQQIVAFIGLGAMGQPIARHISDGGYALRAVDSFPGARLRAAEAGLETFESVEDAVPGADFILMMLPTVEIAHHVFESVVASADPGSMIIEMGTIGHEASAAHARIAQGRGVRYLDAPVIGGGREAAEDGRLKILAGGDEETVQSADPLLRCFSTLTYHVGGDGAGQVMKVIHNLLLAGITAATAEALVLAGRLGVEPDKAVDILDSSSTSTFALNWLFPPALREDYSGGAKVDILLKDIRLAIGDIRSVAPEESWTVAERVHRLYERCQEAGYGGDDMAVVYRLLQTDVASAPPAVSSTASA
ncbi:NAD(P)-dependent oxidoreductase [Arthrobacter sp. TE12232]